MEQNNLGKTTIGIEPKAAALLSYVAGFITGIVLLAIEKDNQFVRFHAMQSTITFGGLFVIQIFLSYMPFIAFISPLISIAMLVLWILLMIKAYQGETFKLPVVGDIAANAVK